MSNIPKKIDELQISFLSISRIKRQVHALKSIKSDLVRDRGKVEKCLRQTDKLFQGMVEGISGALGGFIGSIPDAIQTSVFNAFNDQSRIIEGIAVSPIMKTVGGWSSGREKRQNLIKYFKTWNSVLDDSITAISQIIDFHNKLIESSNFMEMCVKQNQRYKEVKNRSRLILVFLVISLISLTILSFLFLLPSKMFSDALIVSIFLVFPVLSVLHWIVFSVFTESNLEKPAFMRIEDQFSLVKANLINLNYKNLLSVIREMKV